MPIKKIRPDVLIAIENEKINNEVDELNKKYRYFSYKANCGGECKWSHKIEKEGVV